MQVRIHKLDPAVANQIAAGEVIERPGSVLKELLENSLDSGATKIDVYIVGGGITQIKVVDNGVGIVKDDLPLAITQHATSKLRTAQDLDTVATLGFRGEALSSIFAVAEVKLSSKVEGADTGWQITTNMLQPIAHNTGTSIEVNNLFANIPARRKFLRSEKTEYNFLEENFKRIALASFSTTFRLFRDGALVKSLPKCDPDQEDKRLIKIFGANFLKEGKHINVEQNGMKLLGWICDPQYARAQADQQYFYINGRFVKDKLINHALRQAYVEHCDPGRYPSYCLYLSIDPQSLDVNVHPTKHEVRFRDPTIIHHFIYDVLKQCLGGEQIVSKEVEFDFEPDTRVPAVSSPDIKSAINILHVLDNKLIIVKQGNTLNFLEYRKILLAVVTNELHQQVSQGKIDAKNLLMPCTITISNINDLELWDEIGFDLKQLAPEKYVLRKVPKVMHGLDFDYPQIIVDLSQLIHKQQFIDTSILIDCLVQAISKQPLKCDSKQAETIAQRYYAIDNSSKIRYFTAEDLLQLLH